MSGITVIDADSADGIEALQEFLPDTLLMPAVKTPKGQHFYFQYEPGIANQVRIIKDTDVRNDGGYVVAPPSINEAGSPYTWIEGLKVSEVRPPQIPAMLADLLRQGSLT